MKNHYLVEVTQQQHIFVSVEATNSSEAIELALQQQGKIEQPYPPEIEQIKARIIRGE